MSHVIMPKKLAHALMDAGMQHYAGGGQVGQMRSQPNMNTGMGDAISNNQYTNPGGILGGKGSVANQIFNPVGELGGMLFGNTENNFQAAQAGDTQGQILQQYGNQQQVYGQQQALAQQLLAQTQGGGPGQQLLASQGAQNAAQQSALMGSVRGASANPALIARNAALAGQQGQQQLLNAQAGMQLQSQNALGNQYAQMSNESLQGQSIGQGALSSANTVNAGVAAGNAAGNKGLLGGIMGGVSSILGGLHDGGEVKKMADGGGVLNAQPLMGMANYSAPAAPAPAAEDKKSDSGGGLGAIMSLAALLSNGGNVPGQAKTKGDSEQNDVVPTMLSPGEIVIPRSIAQHEDAPEKAAEFIRHLKSSKKMGYGGVVNSRKGKC